MRKIYRQRRIMVIVTMVLSLSATFFAVKAVGNELSQPTFTCQPASIQLGHQMIWNVARNNCKGHITDAAVSIMKDNNIEGKDLRQLLPSTIIVIKGGN